MVYRKHHIKESEKHHKRHDAAVLAEKAGISQETIEDEASRFPTGFHTANFDLHAPLPIPDKSEAHDAAMSELLFYDKDDDGKLSSEAYKLVNTTLISIAVLTS